MFTLRHMRPAVAIWLFSAMLLSAGAAQASSIDSVLQSLPGSGSSSPSSGGAGNSSASGVSGDLRGIVMPGLDRVNIRASAWGEVIATVAGGQFLDIVGEDGDWYIVEYQGKKGYILKQALTTNKNYVKNETAAAKSGTVRLNPAYVLRVRSGAWGDSIGYLRNGSNIRVTGEDGDWYKIEFNGGTGYVYKKYVNVPEAQPGTQDGPAATPAPAMPQTNVPATPSTPSSRPSTAPSNNQLIKWLWDAGFRGEGLRVAWSIAMRESGGIPEIGAGHKLFNGCDWGLFQLNKPTFGKKSWWDDRKIIDPNYSAKIVFELSKGGTYWIPWGISGDGKSMNAACYKMWSPERQMKCIWLPYKKWYDKYPSK